MRTWPTLKFNPILKTHEISNFEFPRLITPIEKSLPPVSLQIGWRVHEIDPS